MHTAGSDTASNLVIDKLHGRTWRRTMAHLTGGAPSRDEKTAGNVDKRTNRAGVTDKEKWFVLGKPSTTCTTWSKHLAVHKCNRISFFFKIINAVPTSTDET